MKGIVKAGNLPNTTSLLEPRQGHPGLGARAVGEGDLVRPDREELDERRELERAPHDAHEHPHRQGDRAAGRQVGEQQDHRRSSTQEPERSQGTRRRVSSDPVPSHGSRCRRSSLRAAPAASPSRPGARSSRRRCPYALIAPALIVIVAILGYPVYFLVRLSFERYGLVRADRPQGRVGRARQLHHDPRRRPVLATSSCARCSSRR